MKTLVGHLQEVITKPGGRSLHVAAWPINTLTTTLTSWWPNKLTNEGRIPESITSCNMNSIQPYYNQSPFKIENNIVQIISHTLG